MIQGRVSRILRVVAPITLVITLAFLFTLAGFAAPKAKAAGLIGPKANYLALGDSLGFGFQPNGDFNNGYADDFFSNMQSKGSKTLTNLSCSGETTVTMINGGCIDKAENKVVYAGSQLQAAVNFLSAHSGTVSPVTLDVGADDFLVNNDVNTTNAPNCTLASRFSSDLAKMDSDLSQTIFPELVAGLTVNGQRTGDLIVPNYYDPEQNLCPNLVATTQEINQHIVNDASGFGVTFADVFTAFGGAATPNNNIDTLTWIGSNFPLDLAIHPRSVGYQLMATTIENTVGY
jgi:lysophospholipase L1-like esterase